MGRLSYGIFISTLALSLLTGCSSDAAEPKYMEAESTARYAIVFEDSANESTENTIIENKENSLEDVEKTAAELIHLPNSSEETQPEDIEDTDKVLISLGKEMETVVTVIDTKGKDVKEPKITDINTIGQSENTQTETNICYFDKTSAPGLEVKQNDYGVIDYSNSSDGYIMVKYTKETTKRLKARVIGPNTTYTYNIPLNEWQSLAVSDGNGKYKIALYENIDGTKYATRLTEEVNIELKDEFTPFLHSNQYVNFENAIETQKKAAELVAGQTENIKKVEKIYNYVVNEFTYDKEKARTVQSGYLPDLDKVLAEKSGICFDYASLMTGMLRSQGIPCKLVVGYVGEAYHAWIDVWSETDGWINGVIQFRMNTWERMDPTFASSGGQSEKMIKYIGDGKNYSAKYYY